MATLHVDIDDRQVLDVLRQLGERFTAQAMRPAMAEIGELLLESTRARFPAGAGPDGTAWAGLAEPTILGRIRKMTGSAWGKKKKDGTPGRLTQLGAAAATRPLIASGKLARESLSYQIINGGTGVAVGTNRSFGRGWDAAIHQFGAPGANIPARPFLGLSDRDRQSVLTILRDMLM